jgi:preprotein translocase subunit YajC
MSVVRLCLNFHGFCLISPNPCANAKGKPKTRYILTILARIIRFVISFLSFLFPTVRQKNATQKMRNCNSGCMNVGVSSFISSNCLYVRVCHKREKETAITLVFRLLFLLIFFMFPLKMKQRKRDNVGVSSFI